MGELHPDLAIDEMFNIENGEKRILASKDNFVYMIVVALFAILGPIVLLLLVPYMHFIRAILSVIIAIPSLLFGLYATAPLIKQFFRGRCIMKIADGQLKNHELSIPTHTIKSVKIGKHPTPLKLWVYDYL